MNSIPNGEINLKNIEKIFYEIGCEAARKPVFRI